MAAPMRLMVAQ